MIRQPIKYLDPDDPPLLLYHGDEDGVVGSEQSELMFEQARERYHDTTYYELDGLGHSSEGMYSALSGKPPAEATIRTVHCRLFDNGLREQVQEGPVASLTNMKQFLRRALWN